MRKLILLVALVTGSFTMNAQFSVGASLGLPTGDANLVSSLSLGIDANYMFSSEKEVNFGVSAGYLTYFGKEILGVKVDNVSFLPIAGALRYDASEKFSLGADVGYAVGLSPDGNDGGFYYRPMVGYSVG
ncbi:MAG: hypothetical protein JXR05_11935 [Flavobacteriaceae bacterium]